MDRPTRSSSETDDESPDLERLRDEIELVNDELLVLLNRRARLVTEVQRVKTREGIPTFIPQREQQQLDDLVTRNKGPFADKTISHLFKEIFSASVALMERRKERTLKVSRAAPRARPADRRGQRQHRRPRRADADRRALRGGGRRADGGWPRSTWPRWASASSAAARSSRARRPTLFRGWACEGLRAAAAARPARYGLVSVTEVMDTRSVELVCRYADILQIGSRNMYNYDLLREVGRCRKPVLLKRGLCATIDELLWSAEYIVDRGQRAA